MMHVHHSTPPPPAENCCCLSHAGGELNNASEITSDTYLKKWLVAREWDVPRTFSCMLHHAQWRARVMPNGIIEEVGCTKTAAEAQQRVQQ